jgi:hypothetical protein
VLDQGWGDRVIGPTWWNERLEQEGFEHRVRLFPHDGGERLTRHDLFELAYPIAGPDPGDGDLLTLLWHVLAWGTGVSQRGNLKRIRAFIAESDRRRNVSLLKDAVKFARGADVGSAYRALIRQGGGQIRGLGPAFFTKFLYFASEGADGTRCLILDARVAGSLSGAGWSSLPWSKWSRYSYNWYAPTYLSYCELLQRWAAEESASRGQEVWPDEIERALFDGEPVE